jgi:hypothetical protein
MPDARRLVITQQIPLATRALQANKLLLDKCHLQVLDLISTFSAPLPPLKGVSGSSSSTAPGAQTGSRSQQGQPLSTGDAGGGEVLLAGPAAVPALVMRHRTARQVRGVGLSCRPTQLDVRQQLL